jgi:hypothetical protein
LAAVGIISLDHGKDARLLVAFIDAAVASLIDAAGMRLAAQGDRRVSMHRMRDQS